MSLIRICLLGLAAQIAVSWSGAAQSTQAAGSQPPLMDRQKEIALALSACPPSVATKAAVYVLDKSGYVKVRDSQNGFTAIVQHALPTSQEPQCMDAEGTRSHHPRMLKVAGSADGYSCDTCTRFWEACQTNADIVCTRSTSTHPGRQGRKSRCANYILSQRRGSPHHCVPNVCQLRRIPPSSIAFNHCENVGNRLIQRVVDKRNAPQPTPAKELKTGFVISRSPVRSRRVAPAIWPEI